MSLKGKLKRFHNHLTQEKKSESRSQPDEQQSVVRETGETKGEYGKDEHDDAGAYVRLDDAFLPTDEKYAAVWERLGAKPYRLDDEQTWVREVRYPLHFCHGHVRFDQLESVVGKWHEERIVHPLSTYRGNATNVGTEDLLFFDTETTGLSGGTGNLIFMLGCAYVRGEEIIVKQFFLPDPASEVSFYHAFLADTSNLKNMVTYNGKAFDWPQLKTRHTLLRHTLPKLPPFGQYDLLHAARRFWKDELSSCRLSNVEATKLGFRREDDTPGHLAPLLYREYLHDPDPAILEGVFRHNEWDVLSLISLYIHLSSIVLDSSGCYLPGKVPLSLRERFQAGRWYEDVRQWLKAERCYEEVAQLSAAVPSAMDALDRALARGAQHRLASLYKKQHRFKEAQRLWTTLAEQLVAEHNQDHHQTEVCVELAKLYEHQLADLSLALKYARQALHSVRKQNRQQASEQAILYRIERLQRKLQVHHKKKTPNGGMEYTLFDL